MGRSRSRSRSRSRRRSRSRSRSRSESFSRSRSRSLSPGHRVHIADLGIDSSKREIERTFEHYGKLVEVWVARNPPCFAFIVFKYKEDAEDAVRDMNGKTLCGNRVRVTLALPRTRGRRFRRGRFDPNLRCYTCGEPGHFSRDCDGYRRFSRYGFSNRRSRTRSRSRSRERRRRSRSRSRDNRRRRSRSRSRSPRGRSASRSRSRSRQRMRKASDGARSNSRPGGAAIDDADILAANIGSKGSPTRSRTRSP